MYCKCKKKQKKQKNPIPYKHKQNPNFRYNKHIFKKIKTTMNTEQGNIKIIKANLLTVNGPIAHCISQDLAMRKGVAKQIRNKFGDTEQLKRQNVQLGHIGVTTKRTRETTETTFCFHMVTKHRYYQKPTLATFQMALQNLKRQLEIKNIKTISIPWIGTGLDRIPRHIVWDILKQVFNKTEIQVIICEL